MLCPFRSGRVFPPAGGATRGKGAFMRKFAFSGFPLIIAAAAMVVYLGQPKRAVNAQTLALDRSLLALLPGDATTLAGFHIEQLKQTAAYRYFEENSRQQNPSGQNELDDFATLTGFD